MGLEGGWMERLGIDLKTGETGYEFPGQAVVK